MRDLTQGPIHKHIIMLALPMAMGMLVQTLYFIVDLYFIAGLGDTALAGVSSAGTLNFAVMALTQMLTVGAVTLISHAVGRKDQVEANIVFNQTIGLAIFCMVLTLALGYGGANFYMQHLASDVETRQLGRTFIAWFLPGLALQFAMAAGGAALRGTGVVKPAMVGQMLTVLVNLLLAPVLIAGWGTGYAMGVAGAGLATSIASLVGVFIMLFYFMKYETYVNFNHHQLRPKSRIYRKLLNIGLPAGAEFFFMFLFMAIIYFLIRDFGPAAQAGFGLGSRVMQAMFLPLMAISFAIAPIAGQNFGAQLPARVRETIWKAIYIESALMLMLSLLCQIEPRWVIHFFTRDEQVIEVATEFLRIISWNFVATGIVFACSGMFQALGNTWPSLISMATRVLSFALPAIWLSQQQGFEIKQLWYLSVATVLLQMFVSLFLVRHQLARRLHQDFLATEKT